MLAVATFSPSELQVAKGAIGAFDLAVFAAVSMQPRAVVAGNQRG